MRGLTIVLLDTLTNASYFTSFRLQYAACGPLSSTGTDLMLKENENSLSPLPTHVSAVMYPHTTGDVGQQALAASAFRIRNLSYISISSHPCR